MAVLVKFRKDWADEFDVYGYAIYPFKEAWEEISESLDGLDYYFGTNEGWEEGDFSEDDFEVMEISDEEAETLKKLFGQSWGNFPL